MILPLLLLAAAPAQAKVHLSTDEALALAFPGCQVQEHTAYLSSDQQARAAELAGAPVESLVVRQYRGICQGELAGTAYFDTHRVRTLPETLMVVVDPAGRIARIEVLSFSEPEEYLPPAGFFGQFQGQSLQASLSFKRSSLRQVTGATLSCDATLDAARRSLALHSVLTQQVLSEGP